MGAAFQKLAVKSDRKKNNKRAMKAYKMALDYIGRSHEPELEQNIESRMSHILRTI